MNFYKSSASVLCGIGLILGLIPVTLAHSGHLNKRLPPGWEVFRGNNMWLFHPQGWRVQEGKKGYFLAYRPNASGYADAFILHQPMRIDGNAKTVIREISNIFPDMFPDAQITSVQQLSKQPQVVKGAFKYSLSGGRFQATALCFNMGPEGALYIMASDASTWEKNAQIMVNILSSLRFAAAPTGGNSPTSYQMTAWQDPMEQAFTCQVPVGWDVRGGLYREHAIDVRPELMATSPDGRIVIRIGDAWIPPMIVENPNLSRANIYRWQWYSPGYGFRSLVVPYLPGVRYLVDVYLPNRVGDCQIVNERNLPEISAMINEMRSRMNDPRIAEAGEVCFNVKTAQGVANGYLYCQTSVIKNPNAPTFLVDNLYGYMAVPEMESTAQRLLLQILQSIQFDPTWQAKQIELAGGVSKVVADTSQKISDTLFQTFRQRWEIEDRSADNFSRYLRDQERVVDPNTGERFDVPAGSEYYWRASGSTNADPILGTDTDERPYHPNFWFHKMTVAD